MNTSADVELSEFHDQWHEIFQRMLIKVTDGAPDRDQVGFVLHSPQLKNDVSFPFLSP